MNERDRPAHHRLPHQAREPVAGVPGVQARARHPAAPGLADAAATTSPRCSAGSSSTCARLDVAGWTQLAVDVRALGRRALDNARGAGLEQAHADFRRGLNIEFGRFVEEQYPRWVRGGRRPSDAVHRRRQRTRSFRRSSDGRRVVFIVIDCMRLDQWFTLEPLLEELFEIERDYYCSILPTATPVLAQRDLLRPAAGRAVQAAPRPVAGERATTSARKQPLRAPAARASSSSAEGTPMTDAQVLEDLRQRRGASAAAPDHDSFAGVPLVSAGVQLPRHPRARPLRERHPAGAGAGRGGVPRGDEGVVRAQPALRHLPRARDAGLSPSWSPPTTARCSDGARRSSTATATRRPTCATSSAST